MRVVILTSTRNGIASEVLPVLCKNKNLNVVNVILARDAIADRKKHLRRKILKTCRIGILGALNGIRIRDWYADKEVNDIASLCQSFNVPLSETPCTNSDETRKLFREAKADLGLSLGNAYIAKSVFSIPRHGMVNIHMELLPDFQGAQSIIWPIYEGIEETGFTIHQIDTKIDTGDILYQSRYAIQFYPTLKETVEKNLLLTKSKIPEAFSCVCEHYENLKDQSETQERGKSYTTPTIWQFFRMSRNCRAMYRRSLTGVVPGNPDPETS